MVEVSVFWGVSTSRYGHVNCW